MKNWKDLKGESLGYKIGYICGSVCILSLVVLLTAFIVIGSARLVFWLLTL